MQHSPMPSRRFTIHLLLGLLTTACGEKDDRADTHASGSGSNITGVANAPGSLDPAQGAPTEGSADAPTANGAVADGVTKPGQTSLDTGVDVGASPNSAPCKDTPPEGTFTCAEQAGWGKCNEAWMVGRCDASCGRCALAPPVEVAGGGPSSAEPLDPIVDGVEPVAANPSPRARRLLRYLHGMYGQRMLSGQMESDFTRNGPEYEIDYVLATTGKLPAVRGLDFIDWDGVAERSIAWWDRGGIVNIRWHWGAPTFGQGYEASQEQVDIDRVLTPGTPEHASMLDGLDRTAAELATLRDADVPVLWTPFHELNGDWFWWGKGSPEQFVQLWRFMFDYFDAEKGLNNLIWVLGYSGQPDGAWYPGDAYVDIAGSDSYARSTEPQLRMFDAVRAIVGPEMPVSYHECGIIPDPTLAQAQGANWSWFMTWHTNWVIEENTPEHLNAVYNHDFVITLDELPDLR